MILRKSSSDNPSTFKNLAISALVPLPLRIFVIFPRFSGSFSLRIVRRNLDPIFDIPFLLPLLPNISRRSFTAPAAFIFLPVSFFNRPLPANPRIFLRRAVERSPFFPPNASSIARVDDRSFSCSNSALVYELLPLRQFFSDTLD